MVKWTSGILLGFSLLGWVLFVYAYGNYASLRADYATLEADYTGLEDKYSRLQTNYGSLKTRYDSLNASHGALESRLNSLLSRAQSLAQSASWFSTDSRLRVTSEIVAEELYFSTLYYVRVNVTNIGDKPLKDVWIFLFRYKGGELEWNSWSGCKDIENLYLGETCSYDFQIYDDVTSYIVFAIGGTG